MNRRLLPFFLLLLGSLTTLGQVQYVTENPRIDEINDPDVSIRRVELTDQYTIIYMKFQSRDDLPGRGQRIPSIPFPLPNGGRSMPSITTNTIMFEPTARLYVNQGERSYKFVRAENISIERRREVSNGERVDFIVYFERITPGYPVFDLFECRDGKGNICFNFWGVHINNPARKDTYSQRTPRPTSPPVTPRPQQPRATPRITPGVGTPDAPATKPQPEPAPAPSAIAINGVTRDARTKKPIGATVTYQLLSGAESAGNEPADSVQSEKPSGTYKIAVERRGVYAVTASAKGYFSQSDTLATNRIDLARDFDLVPITTGAKVTLKNLYFNVSKFDLKPESYPELDRLVTLMQDNPSMSIRLEGHTDTVGDFDANVELSRNRVNEVKRYVVSKGISASRIETVGYGPSRPINTNRSLKERPENRRVELVIVKA